MTLKLLRYIWLTALLLGVGLSAASQQAQPYFPLPDVPASIENYNDRTNYLVEHYWDRCNWKNAFSSRQGMASAFTTFIDLLPLASQHAVHKSVDELLKNLKKNPEGLKFMVERAEAELYSDSAAYQSDEIFIKFLKAAVDCKKLDKTTRERYRKLESRISHSMQDSRIPADLTMTLRDGSQRTLGSIVDADTTSITLIYLYDPKEPSYSLDRLRLDANSRLNSLIDAGQVNFIALYPAVPDNSWREDAAKLSERWIVAASPDADMMLDMQVFPSFFIIDDKGIIRKKNISGELLLNWLYSL